MKDYYAVLEITPGASEEVVKAAYKALVKKYHPDNNQGQVAEEMKEINEAYDVLSDPEKRAEYDADYEELQMENAGTGDVFHAEQQMNREMTKVEPESLIRARVQGLKYCGLELRERNEVTIYLNFVDELHDILRDFRKKGKAVSFKGEIEDINALTPFISETFDKIDEAFHTACAQVGLGSNQIEGILLFLNDSDEHKEPFMEVFSQYAQEFVAILGEYDESFAERSDQLTYELENNLSEGGGGVLGSLLSFGKHSLSGAIQKHETEEALKQLSKEYREALFTEMERQTELYSDVFVKVCVQSLCGCKWMSSYTLKGQELEMPGNLPNDSNERLQVFVRLLNQQPYWENLYKRMLDEYGDQDGTLEQFAKAYDIDLVPIKEKMMTYFFAQSNVEEDEFLSKYKEKAVFLSYRNDSMYFEKCKKFVDRKLRTMFDFSENAIREFEEKMQQFDKTHEYDSLKERNEYILEELIRKNGIQWKSKEKNVLEKSLEQLKDLDARYPISFQIPIGHVEDALEKIRKEEEEKERQRDIAARTVEFITSYDVKEKTATTTAITLDTLDEVETFQRTDKEIRDKLEKISFDVSGEEWSSNISEIRSLCTQNGYPGSDFLEKLQADYEKADLKFRTFDGCVYRNRVDAEHSRKDAETISKIDRKTFGNNVERLRQYNRNGLTSRYGQAQIHKLEKAVIEGYKNKEKDMASHIASSALAVPIKILEILATIAMVAVVIAGVVAFFAVGPLALIALLPFFLFSAIRGKLSDYDVSNKPMDYDGISVEGNQIVWLDTCTTCWEKIGKGLKVCPKCGTALSEKNRIAVRPNVPKVETVKASASKTNATKPEVSKTDTVKPEASKTDTVKPEASKTDTVKPEASKTDTVKPEASKADTVTTEVTNSQLKEEEEKVICPKCGKELRKGTKFCNYCGQTVLEMKTCPKCGKQILPTVKFCNYCGEIMKENES